MKGWKTWAGAGLIAASAALKYLGHDDLVEALLMIGAALGLVGIGHKIERTNHVPRYYHGKEKR